jgi:NADPH:quinone reductase-like Zn-dependent oxidoreductase
MRAIAIDQFKTPGSLREFPDPIAAADEVVIRVTYAGINPIDFKVRDGLAGDRKFPMVLGQDFAGVVKSVGASISRVKVGDRVFGCARHHGAYAEQTKIQEGQHDSPFAVIPDGVTDIVAAALPTPGLTAYASLEKLEVGSGTTLLIAGEAGSVGAAAVQIAHKRGAIVTGLVKPGQAQEVREFGADDTVESADDLTRAIAAGERKPFDTVLDLISDADHLKKYVSWTKKGGKLVSTIHTADEAWFKEQGMEATNITMLETPQSTPQGLGYVAQLVAKGDLRIDVAAEKPFEDGSSALNDVKAGKAPGKVVLRVRE